MDIFAVVVWLPFRILATQLLEMVPDVLLYTPTVAPNPAVEQVHEETLTVSVLCSVVAASATGLLYMTGPIFNLSYRQVRLILPRLVVTLAFAAVSLTLLQYSVDITRLLTQAFAPSDLAFTTSQVLGISAQLVVVWLIQALLLLVVVGMFLIRDVYLLFAAAISPLIAVAWAFPPTQKYAQPFIAGWWTALAMAPLDMLVFRFTAELLTASGSGLQAVSNWVFGIAAYLLLILIPYQLYGVASRSIGQASLLARGVRRRVRDRNQGTGAEARDGVDSLESRRDRDRSRSQTATRNGSNKFRAEMEEFRDD